MYLSIFSGHFFSGHFFPRQFFPGVWGRNFRRRNVRGRNVRGKNDRGRNGLGEKWVGEKMGRGRNVGEEMAREELAPNQKIIKLGISRIFRNFLKFSGILEIFKKYQES
jgi:hypothetical protein